MLELEVGQGELSGIGSGEQKLDVVPCGETILLFSGAGEVEVSISLNSVLGRGFLGIPTVMNSGSSSWGGTDLV